MRLASAPTRSMRAKIARPCRASARRRARQKSPCRCGRAWRRPRSLPRSPPTCPSTTCRARCRRSRAARATRRAPRTSAAGVPCLRRQRHEAAQLEPRQLGDRACELVNVRRCRAAFLRLAALIDLDQHVLRRRERGALLVEALGNAQTIDGVDPIEALRDETRLVRLQLADEMPSQIVSWQGRPSSAALPARSFRRSS